MPSTALLIMDVQQGADGCLDADPEVHRVLLGKVFPRQAEVTTIADWTAGLSAA
jgi:hypothetical protein